MARSYIGIVVAGDYLRGVVLEENSGKLETRILIEREIENFGDAAEIVASVLREHDISNPRLALALPATGALTRQLEFPFGDRKKIDAAVPFEMNSRLPVDLEEYHVTALTPVRRHGKYFTTGLAVPIEQITTALGPFDELQLPLRYLGLTPFAYAGQFHEQPQDSFLVEIGEHEISVLLQLDGVPAGHRSLARGPDESAAEATKRIRREVLNLQNSTDREDLPVLVFGAGLDEEFRMAFRALFPAAEIPLERFDGDALPPEFLPALALARRAAESGQGDNLRRGVFAFRSSLAPFKKQLIAAAVLVAITVASGIGGAWLSYTRQAKLSANLQEKMENIYLQTFRGADNPPKDILLHMTSRLNAARTQSSLLGGPAVAPLPVLEAISRAFPEESRSVIRELSYDNSGLRLSGQAESFDAVDQLAARLNGNQVFSAARISDAKTNIDGKLVDFRIDLEFAGKEGQP